MGTGTSTTPPTEREELLDALARAAGRFADLASRVRDPDAVVDRSEWSAADIVAHVAAGLETYARYLGGDTTPAIDVTDLAGGSLIASNAARLAEEPERSIDVLGERAAIALTAVSTASRAHSLDDIVSWHGRPEPLRCLLATAIAEQLLHGRDLAGALGEPWSIERRDAQLVVVNIAPLLPILVDPATTRSLTATIRIRLRGGRDISLAFADGVLTVGGEHRRYDATVSADPVAFLLVAYGRRSQWAEIARGRLVAWGRRPWLAVRLTSYLVRP